MEFIQFIQRERGEFSYLAIVTTILSGLFSALLAMIIIHAARATEPQHLNFKYFAMFAVTLAAFWFARRYTLNYTTQLVEDVLENVRMRIADKIRHTELPAFESIGTGRLYAALNTDSLTISQYTPFILNAAGSVCMVIFGLAGILYFSLPAFLMTLVVVSISVLYFRMTQNRLNADLLKTSIKESEYYDALGDLIGGFKELKINSLKNDSFYQQRMTAISNTMRSLKIDSGIAFNKLHLFGQSFSFILLASIVFLIPQISAESAKTVPQVAAILLFVIGPLGEIVNLIPLLTKCNVAIGNIKKIERDLDNKIDKTQPPEKKLGRRRSRKSQGEKAPFETIECRELQYTYRDANGQPIFHLGPINLDIKRGDLIFLVGGNGSGKSTFIKLFTALYVPDSGYINVDGNRLTPSDTNNYRNLFSPIFSDFHLFKQLYGIDEIDEDYLDELFDTMQLSDRTDIVDGEITDTQLSTGQKKRMALIVALLENKPFYIFDEWAADQDPEFRRYFYETILPDMRAKGITVLAATHDDRYFHLADRIIKLDAGQLVSNTAPNKST